MANVSDLYYDFCDGVYTHNKFNDLIIKHKLMAKFSDHISHLDYDADEILYSIDMRAIETGKTKYLYMAREFSSHLIPIIFKLAWDQGRPLVIKYIIDNYPTLIGVINTSAIDARKYISLPGPIIHLNQKKRCLIMLLHHIRYNKSVSVICKRLPNFLNYIKEFITYIDTKSLNLSQFNDLINAIQNLYSDMLNANIPQDILDSSQSAELIGAYIYKNKDLQKKLFDRFNDVGGIVFKYILHSLEHKYGLNIHSIRDVIMSAVSNFNIPLIKALRIRFCNNNTQLFTIDNYTNNVILYLYEMCKSPIDDYSNDIVMSKPLFTIRERRSKITVEYASKYVINDIAQIIGAYVPFELVEIEDLPQIDPA